jgi:hypothetical protein
MSGTLRPAHSRFFINFLLSESTNAGQVIHIAPVPVRETDRLITPAIIGRCKTPFYLAPAGPLVLGILRCVTSTVRAASINFLAPINRFEYCRYKE